MAETAKDLAFALFDQGKSPGNPEVKKLGLKRKTRYNYLQLWKKANPENGGTTPREPKGTTPSKAGTPTTPITVGKITINP